MSFTVEDFPDLLNIVNTHPKWRLQLVKFLFPNIDLAQSLSELHQALKELAQTQARTELSLDEATEDRWQIRVEFNTNRTYAS